MTRPLDFDRQLIAARPALMKFAIKLCRRSCDAEDLVQLAMLRAVDHFESFEMGTSMKAWVFTILRNEFYSRNRRQKREVPDVDGALAATLTTKPDQADAYDLKIILGRMDGLNPIQRASIELVAMDGLAYEEVAGLLDIPIGTVKSALHRAREYLSGFDDGYGRSHR